MPSAVWVPAGVVAAAGAVTSTPTTTPSAADVAAGGCCGWWRPWPRGLPSRCRWWCACSGGDAVLLRPLYTVAPSSDSAISYDPGSGGGVGDLVAPTTPSVPAAASPVAAARVGLAACCRCCCWRRQGEEWRPRVRGLGEADVDAPRLLPPPLDRTIGHWLFEEWAVAVSFGNVEGTTKRKNHCGLLGRGTDPGGNCQCAWCSL